MNAPIGYSTILVVLSIVIAMQAGYVGIKLAIEIPGAFSLRRRGLIAGSAATLAVGIWSMHFIGMLAVRSQVNIDYAVLPTLLSFLVCGLVTGVAVYLASLRSQRLIGVAAVVMGLGITTMHYVGMIAVHSVLGLTHDPAYGLASLTIAVAASGLALWLAFSADRRPPLPLCAVMFGCAVSGMHYVAMAGTTVHLMPMPSAEPGLKPVLSGDMLAIVVSVVACAISAVFMLALIPKEDVRPDPAGAADAETGEAASGQRTDGGEAPRHADDRPPIDAASAEALPVERMPPPAILLPIEKNDNRFHVAADQIVSVHATAHYTYLFNGRDDLFCPLSITEIEGRLPKASFFRTHRSYIVNLAFVIRIKRAGDAAAAELDVPMRRDVPVSRARLAALRQELATFKSGADTAKTAKPLQDV